MRQMRLERDTLLFGFLVSGDIVWHAEFWWDVELSGCPFVLESALIFPFLTAQLKANGRFYIGLSKTGFKFTEEFSTESFSGSLLGLETQGFAGTEHIMQMKEEASEDVVNPEHSRQTQKGQQLHRPRCL